MEKNLNIMISLERIQHDERGGKLKEDCKEDIRDRRNLQTPVSE